MKSKGKIRRKNTGLKCVFFLFLWVAAHTFAQSTHLKKEAGMVLIPSGQFTLFFKKKTDKPVIIQTFYLDTYEVTNWDYLQFVKANPEWQKSKVSRLYADINYLSHWEGDLSLGKNYDKIKNSPVTNVSWFAANAYSKWKKKRLPTVIEWEYVASLDQADRNSARKLNELLDWYNKPCPAFIPSVGTTYKNKYGVYDMFGLIWEWVYDFNSFISSGDSKNGSSGASDLFCGFGSAVSLVNQEDYVAYMRYGFRESLKGNYTVSSLGFRCAKNYK